MTIVEKTFSKMIASGRPDVISMYKKITDQIVSDDDGNYECMYARRAFVDRIAWGTPNPDNLEAIAKSLEDKTWLSIGCGNAFVEKFLADTFGSKFILTDIAPKNANVTKATSIEAASRFCGEANGLFTSWPPYADPMAFDALKTAENAGKPFKYIFYIGESSGGCTGDENFHYHLDDKYTTVEEFSCVQWYGIHDYCSLYVLKDESTPDDG